MLHKQLMALAVATSLASIWTGPEVKGQEAIPVYISFEFRQQRLSRLFSPNETAAEQQVANLLVERLQKALRYWRFQAGNSARYPQLKCWLERETDWKARIQLWIDANQQPEEWIVTVLGPGDLESSGGWPPPPQIPGKIVGAIANDLLGQRKSDVLKLLQLHLPVGAAVALPAVGGPAPVGQPYGVLGLRWEEYYFLAMSTFRIFCQGTAGKVTLYSYGTGDPWEFALKPPAFIGIKVFHKEIEIGNEKTPVNAQALAGLNPLYFYIDQFDPRGEYLSPQLPQGPVAAPKARTVPVKVSLAP